MLSVETSEVSIDPGRKVFTSWYMKLCWPSGLLELKMKSRSTHMYCAPTEELRFAKAGGQDRTGGFMGLGPT